jgi:DNA-directed RNA polymerase subunit RPC12/RpoP
MVQPTNNVDDMQEFDSLEATMRETLSMVLISVFYNCLPQLSFGRGINCTKVQLPKIAGELEYTRLMHHLRSVSSVFRFRLGALVFAFQWLVLLGSIGVLAYAYARDEREVATYASFGLLAGLLMLVLAWMLASRANCPLCMMPVLSNKRCAKHRKAKTILGSHQARVATSILFLNSFVCPYCLEQTAVKVRPSGIRRVGSRGTRTR